RRDRRSTTCPMVLSPPGDGGGVGCTAICHPNRVRAVVFRLPPRATAAAALHAVDRAGLERRLPPVGASEGGGRTDHASGGHRRASGHPSSPPRSRSPTRRTAARDR